MEDIVDLARYPLTDSTGQDWRDLVARCQDMLDRDGLFNLPGFVRPEVVARVVDDLQPLWDSDAFRHARRHNIYFKPEIDGLEPDHPALRQFETSNRTLCADRVGRSAVVALYEWPPFVRFLAAVMGKPKLFTMDDPLARVNVMAYSAGQALNWHFDRSEFTTTLLLQAPAGGGAFEYAKDLRSDTDPNYAGVADLLEGREKPVLMPLTAGTLNVFKGKNTAHRVTPVQGEKDRVIAVFSYYETPGVAFSDEDRIGFYGRAS